MTYTVMPDYGDLLVLSVHGRVIMISRDMSEITAKMTEHYTMRRDKAKETIEKANISTKNLKVEERPPYKQRPLRKPRDPNNEGPINTLGKLFEL